MNRSSFVTLLAGTLLAGSAYAATVQVTTVSGFDDLDRGIPGEPFVGFDLGSSSIVSLWDGLSSKDHPDYPGFPGGAWPSHIAPNSGSTSASLQQVSAGAGGTAYPASSSLYFGGTALGDIDGGALRVYESSPVSSLSTVVFQLQMGQAIVFDFYQDQMPTLSYTAASGTVEYLEADYSSIFGDIPSPGYGPWVNASVYTYGFQWDLSGVGEEVTEFWVTMNPVQHAQIYGMQLDQGSLAPGGSILPAAIPEPANFLYGIGALLGLLVLRRRGKA